MEKNNKIVLTITASFALILTLFISFAISKPFTQTTSAEPSSSIEQEESTPPQSEENSSSSSTPESSSSSQSSAPSSEKENKTEYSSSSKSSTSSKNESSKTQNNKPSQSFKNKSSKTSSSTSSKIIPVQCILQKPELPTGCESTSLTMVLNFLGYNVSKTEIAETYLPKSQDFYTYNGELHGPDFRYTFPGNPFTQNGYGCLAPAIVTTANNYLRMNDSKGKIIVKNISGSSPSQLYKYIDEGTPVIVWATISMQKPEEGDSWITPKGELLTFPSHEHCLVLVGYDESNVTLCDPLEGTVQYPRNLFETRYSQLNSQAVILKNK